MLCSLPYCQDCRNTVDSTKLDTPSYSIRVILENTDFLQKLNVFSVQADACPYGFEAHNRELGYDNCHPSKRNHLILGAEMLCNISNSD